MAWIALLGTLCLLVSLSGFAGVARQDTVFAKLRSVVVGVAFLTVAALGLGLVAAMRSFEAFASSKPVAQIQCRWVGPKVFKVDFTPLHEGEPQPTHTFTLRGDQWSIGGGVVKWHPWLTVVGVPSYHKLTRLSGRYATVEDEVASAPTAVELNGGFDAFWEWVVRFDPLLPFVEAAYGSTVYTYVNPSLTFQIEVAPSGYLIRSLRNPLQSPPS